MEHRRRVTLFEQMSDVDSRRELAGLTLENILANQKRTTAPPLPLSQQRTLLDVIREDNSSKKDKNSWRAFKDKLRLIRAGSFLDIPIAIPNNNNHRSLSQSSRRNAVRSDTPHVAGDNGGSNAPAPAPRPQSSPPISSSPRIPSNAGSVRRDHALTIAVNLDADHHHTVREGTRRLSVREAMALQDAAAAPAAGAEVSAMEPARMSLMDLLEETEEAMALEIPTSGEKEEEGGDKERSQEFYCCVCMIRQKGAAFIPCGHTFCRLCSRELWVQRGNCPLCNNSISEILDIF